MAREVPHAREPRRLVFLLLPRVHILDVAGPAQAFAEAAVLGGSYKIRHCSPVPELTTAQGLVLGRLEQLPAPTAVDRVIVPGMDSSVLGSLDVPTAWLRAAYQAGADVCSVCSGAFALGHAGLLDGRECTTHWKATDRLQREHPRARVLQNRLFVRDGRIVSSAGVASGIDMALFLIEEDHGPLVASRVAREMVVWLRRDGAREQISAYLDHRTHLNPGVHRVQDWIVSHPEARPSLAELSRIAGVSPRHLTRMFRTATGISPKGFMNKIKLEVAASLMHAPQLTLEGIAQQCGFRDPRQLRRLWKRCYGVPLSQSRREPQPARTEESISAWQPPELAAAREASSSSPGST